MKHYILAHWRGELSLARSFLVNGLLGLLVIFLAFATVSQFVPEAALVGFGLALLCGWMVWATVGIFRCAIGIFRRPTSASLRVCAILAILLSAATLYLLIADVHFMVTRTLL